MSDRDDVRAPDRPLVDLGDLDQGARAQVAALPTAWPVRWLPAAA